MAINTTLESVSTTAASNGPAGSDQRTIADDGLRQYVAFIKQLKTLATLASATTVTPPSTANVFSVTGTTAITTIASTNSWDGRDIWFVFAGALTFTHGSNLILPGATNITTAAGDCACMIQVAAGQWRCAAYQRADGSLLLVSAVVAGALNVNGDTTLGNAGADAVVVNGSATFTGPTSGDTISLTQVAGAFAIVQQHSLSGSISQWLLQNGSNTSGSDARIYISTAGSSAGDSYALFDIAGVMAWAVGTDNSDGDTFKVDTGAAMTTVTNRFNVTTDGRWYGNALHNNAGAVTGTTNQYVASGTYTPTDTNVLNVAASTMREAQWMRVGNVVEVSGQCDIDPTAGSAFTLGISLPIATVMDFGYRLNGTMGTLSSGVYGTVFGDGTNDRASLTCPNNTSAASDTWCYHFTYLIQS